MKLLFLAQKRLEEIGKAILRCEKCLSALPATEETRKLEIKTYKNQVRYYLSQGSKENRTEEYLPKDAGNVVILLARRTYYERMLQILQDEERVLKKFIKNYRPEKKYKLYDNMCRARKEMIKPLFISVADQVKAWQEEKYEQCDFHREGLIYETDRGENVRSKTEVIEANSIGRRKNLDYRYEKPLYLPDSDYPIYPDFTIINKKTGKVFYLEHAGKMDDSDYANDFITKMNRYIKAGIVPGKDLWVTFESAEVKFDMAAFKKILDEIEDRG